MNADDIVWKQKEKRLECALARMINVYLCFKAQKITVIRPRTTKPMVLTRIAPLTTDRTVLPLLDSTVVVVVVVVVVVGFGGAVNVNTIGVVSSLSEGFPTLPLAHWRQPAIQEMVWSNLMMLSSNLR
jgi:hypothetical protein